MNDRQDAEPAGDPLYVLAAAEACAAGYHAVSGSTPVVVSERLPEGAPATARRVVVAWCGPGTAGPLAALGPDPAIARARAAAPSSCPLVVVADRAWAHELRRLAVTQGIAEVLYTPCTDEDVIAACLRVAG